MNQTVPTVSLPGSGIFHNQRKQGVAALTLAALGVVYGDIGTSPLYTFKEIFGPQTGIPPDPLHVTGAVSVIVWALILVVTLKYVCIVLRADNRGEGGILALTALMSQVLGQRRGLKACLMTLGLFGTTLFYGDSVITPAISVLGAIEGLQVVTPGLEAMIIPVTVAILIVLFSVQRLGTGKVGTVFGPVVLLWFLMLAAAGLYHIARQPEILAALNPLHAWHFLLDRGWQVFAALGVIVLALTGAEALYADMGHFGRRPVQLAWTFLVLPALALNYAGQGALLLADPAAITNPFYLMFPPMLQWPALILATLAAIIASQAVISGAYSLTRQAIQLGYLPRMSVRHTSAHAAGQIYLSAVNWCLLVAVIAAVLFFGSSSNLVGAYGIAVTMTMLVTTVLALFVMRSRLHVPLPVFALTATLFLLIDLMLVAGSAIKLPDGGWFPLLLGVLLFGVMYSWKRGRSQLLASMAHDGIDLPTFVQSLQSGEFQRAKRIAVYMAADPTAVPQALLHNLKHYQTLHETNVIVTVEFAEVPWVDDSQRAVVESLGNTFWKVTLLFGFLEAPDVPRTLQSLEQQGLRMSMFQTSYFLSRETLVISARRGLGRWQQGLFAMLSRNAGGVVEFFRLPDNAVVELGSRVRL